MESSSLSGLNVIHISDPSLRIVGISISHDSSVIFCASSQRHKSTPSKDQIQEGCLIKWESKNNPVVLRLARLLIWVAYNAERRPEASYQVLATEFDLAFHAIKEAENNLYHTPNRHLASADVESKEAALQAAIESFQNRMPSVFDPFAGGGAIPLEAARLGCRSYGNDINPVAHIIEKGSVEFQQKYGKPITYTHDDFMFRRNAELHGSRICC